MSHLVSTHGEGDGPTKGLELGLGWPQSCTLAHARTQLGTLTQFQVLHFPGSLLGLLVLLQTLATGGKAQPSFPLFSQQPLSCFQNVSLLDWLSEGILPLCIFWSSLK